MHLRHWEAAGADLEQPDKDGRSGADLPEEPQNPRQIPQLPAIERTGDLKLLLHRTASRASPSPYQWACNRYIRAYSPSRASRAS